MARTDTRTSPPCVRQRGDDAGSTFVELLVAIVLIGLVVTAVMTALNVSIRGSDQHKSKIMALAELEGAAAHLNRVLANDATADCNPSAPPVFVFDNALNTAYAPGGPLDDPNRGTDVDATNVVCTGGVALVTLVATHSKGNASERLDVTVGGITVLEDGNLGVIGVCSWVTAAVDNPNPVLKGGGRLDSTVTVTLSYVGDCTAKGVTLRVTNAAPLPTYPVTVVPMALNGTALSGVFQFTFSKNYYTPWKIGPVNLLLTTSTGPTYTLAPAFTVL